MNTTVSLLSTTAAAIQNLSDHYTSNRSTLEPSLNLLHSTLSRNGKLVVSGIGKSHKISVKITSTLNSLSLPSTTLHPSEALHGDLGVISPNDCLIFVTASGNTQELINLLPHIPNIPIVLLTCSPVSKLSQHKQISTVLLAPLLPNHKEEEIYGLSAPTVSTTLMLVLADSVIIGLSEMYRKNLQERQQLFGERHPGGSIGEVFRINSFQNLNDPSKLNPEFHGSVDGSVDTCVSRESIDLNSTDSSYDGSKVHFLENLSVPDHLSHNIEGLSPLDKEPVIKIDIHNIAAKDN